jgi:hypothetical protein
VAYRVEAASSLSQIDPEHPDAIPVVEYSGLYSHLFSRCGEIGQINPNKPEWIAALVDQVKFNPTDESEELTVYGQCNT